MSAPMVVEGPAALKENSGRHVGYTDWFDVTQEQVQQFADATGDHQWIHVDPVRAAEGPFGGAIAHGFLTLALIPRVLPELLDVRGFTMAVNYGLEKVRFPSPVPVGSRIRAGMTLDDVKDVTNGVQLTETLTFEVEGSDKPACVATFVERRFF